MIKVSKGRIPKAKKVVLYGPEGIGKSTFASQFPDPVFVDTEGSTAAMDVARIEPLSWTELLSDVREIINGNVDVPCKTIVIDTADWAEKMCADHVCAQNRWDSISSPGYGTGYRVAWEEFGKLLNLLSEATDKGFNVVITAHAAMRKFEQPDEAGSYDRWELKLQNSPKSNICAIVKEWGDMVLFANYKTIVTKIEGKNKVQGGSRVMYTSHHPCWDAKNRYGLPDEIPMDYEAIRGVIEDAPGKETPQAWPVKKDTQNPEPEKESKPEPKQIDMEDVINHPEPPKTEEPEQKKSVTADQNVEVVPHGKKTAEDQWELPEGIPKGLCNLMVANNVTDWEIQNVVGARGYFPADMPISDYPEDFINGVLIGAWEQVFGMIKNMRKTEEVPFN